MGETISRQVAELIEGDDRVGRHYSCFDVEVFGHSRCMEVDVAGLTLMALFPRSMSCGGTVHAIVNLV